MSKISIRDRNKGTGRKPNYEYRFEAASINGKRKRISKSGFKTKKEALEAGAKALTEYNSYGTIKQETKISFSDYLDLWLERYAKKQVADITYHNYKEKIDRSIRPALGYYPLQSINPILLTDFFQSLKDEGFSKYSISSIRTIVASALKYAVSPMGLIQQSPMPYVNMPKFPEEQQTDSESKRGSHPHHYITAEQFEKIVKRFPPESEYHLPLIIGYRLALRKGEVFGLSFDDFDFDKNLVTIKRQMQWNKSKSCWTVKLPKKNSVRTISVDSNTITLVKDKMLKTAENKLFYAEYYTGYKLNEENEIIECSADEMNFINVRENGKVLNPAAFSNCASIIHHELDIPEFSFHSLRHTHATDLVVAKASTKFIQNRLGHKSPEITIKTYEHITTEIEQQGQGIINEMYKEKSKD